MAAKYGLRQSEISEKSITKDFHTKKDISYTLIPVLFQKVKKEDCND